MSVTILVELLYSQHCVVRRDAANHRNRFLLFERVFPRAPCAFRVPTPIHVRWLYVYEDQPKQLQFLESTA